MLSNYRMYPNCPAGAVWVRGLGTEPAALSLSLSLSFSLTGPYREGAD